MSRAWMPFYTGDFLADTMHLSCTERGIYISLIIHCWQHGSIPRDARKLARISACDSRLWHQYERTVLQFFDVVDASTMQHRRVTTELRRYAELSSKRKASAEQQHRQKDASAEHLHTQSQSPSPTTEVEAKASPSVVALAAKRGSRLADDWQPSDADLQEAGKIGLRLYEIDNEIPKFRDYWKAKAGPNAVKRDWSATWRNWCRKATEHKGNGNGARSGSISAACDELIARAEERELKANSGDALDLRLVGDESGPPTPRTVA